MATTVNHEAELGVWNKVKDSTEPQDLRAYLERFPAGIYALRAQLRLDQLALDNTASRAKTEPFFRPPTAAHDDLDSTIGPFPSTFPADTAHMPEAAPLASTSAPDAAPAGMRISARKNLWLLALLGLLAFGLLLAVYVVLRSAAPDSKVVVAPAKQPEEVILETSSDAPQTAPARASAPAQVLPAKLPLSTAGTAQGAARPVFKPKTVADTQTADVTDVVPQVPPPVAYSQSSTHGPSQPGQVCADKVFIFRVACVAEQCGKDKYRQTQECIRFKEMDRAREELHKNQR
jgi:hypothetical protein